MICGGIGTFSSSANSGPVNKPKVSGSIPSACKPAFGRRSNVTGNFSARSRKGFGSAASVASTSAKAAACSVFQFALTAPIWRDRPPGGNTVGDFFLALERRRFKVV